MVLPSACARIAHAPIDARLSTLAYRHSGSANIYVLDARDFGLLRTLPVRAGLNPLRRINELQYIRGELWANVWGDQRLAVICPTSGAVQRFVDLSGLMSAAERRRLKDPRCGHLPAISLPSPCHLPAIS